MRKYKLKMKNTLTQLLDKTKKRFPTVLYSDKSSYNDIERFVIKRIQEAYQAGFEECKDQLELAGMFYADREDMAPEGRKVREGIDEAEL